MTSGDILEVLAQLSDEAFYADPSDLVVMANLHELFTKAGEWGGQIQCPELVSASATSVSLLETVILEESDCAEATLRRVMHTAADVGALVVENDRFFPVPSPEIESQAVAPEQERRRKVRILLVEDDITSQRVALKILSKMGYHADVVANGVEALTALETIPYNLVLMDGQMPEMDGFEATRRIRDPKSAVLRHDIPIIAVTAQAMNGDREKFLAAGMNDYMTKPVRLEQLEKVIARWTPSRTERNEKENQTPTEPVLAVFDRSKMSIIFLPPGVSTGRSEYRNIT